MATEATEATELVRKGSYLAIDPRGVMVSPHPWRNSFNCFRVEMLLYGEQVIIDDVLIRGDVTKYHLSKGGWVSRMSRGGKLQLAQYDEYQIEGSFVVVHECNLFRDPVPGMFCYPTKCIPKHASFRANLKCVVETRKSKEQATFYSIFDHPIYSGWVPADNIAPARKIEALCTRSSTSLDPQEQLSMAENDVTGARMAGTSSGQKLLCVPSNRHNNGNSPRTNGEATPVDDRQQLGNASVRVKGDAYPKSIDFTRTELGEMRSDSRELANSQMTPSDKKLREMQSDSSMSKRLDRSVRRNFIYPMRGMGSDISMTNISQESETEKMKKKMDKKKMEKRKMEKKMERKRQLSATATTDQNIEDLDTSEDTRLAGPADPEPSRSHNSSPCRNAPGMSRSGHLRRNSRNRET